MHTSPVNMEILYMCAVAALHTFSRDASGYNFPRSTAGDLRHVKRVLQATCLFLRCGSRVATTHAAPTLVARGSVFVMRSALASLKYKSCTLGSKKSE